MSFLWKSQEHLYLKQGLIIAGCHVKGVLFTIRDKIQPKLYSLKLIGKSQST